MGVPMGMPYAMPGVSDPRSGQAITSLVLGIIGLVLCWLGAASICAVVPIIVNVLGLIFGILGRASFQRKSLATAGLILSIIGLALTLGFVILYVITTVASASQPSYSSY